MPTDLPQGHDSPEESQGKSAPEAFTADAFNRAFSARSKAESARLEKLLADRETAMFAKFEEFASRFATAPKDVPHSGAPTSQAPSQADSPEMRGLQKQLESLKRQNDAIQAERDAERAKSRDSLLRQKTSDALSAAGITGTKARAAIALLVSEDKRIRYSGDGDDLAFRDSDDLEVDFHTGIRSWLKSDEAKEFLPPRGASGSGERPGGQPPRKPAVVPTQDDVIAEFAKALSTGQL